MKTEMLNQQWLSIVLALFHGSDHILFHKPMGCCMEVLYGHEAAVSQHAVRSAGNLYWCWDPTSRQGIKTEMLVLQQ